MPNTVLADLRTSALVDLISGIDSSPGAGAAGAVTLALAAACGAKAVAISLKHSPSDVRLTTSLARFGKLSRCALQGADADSQEFAEFLRNRTAKRAGELVDSGEAMARLIDALFSIIEDVEPHVRHTMAGDLVAAKALGTAARAIQAANEAEAIEQLHALAQQPSD
jgi:hypothetical protein